MNPANQTFKLAANFLHERFLWLLCGSYLAAAIWPAAGKYLRVQSVGCLHLRGEACHLSASMLFLAFILFNAGLGVRRDQLVMALRRPTVLFVGICANLIYPLLLIVLLMVALKVWHNSTEARILLLGLAVVAAMPIAGSSTGWAQNASGNMALSLAMVLLSTLCSPLTTPAALHSINAILPSAHDADLLALTENSTTAFLVVCVVIPSLLGMLVGCLIGPVRLLALKPVIRFVNSLILLVLCYANASACLPQVFADPDWDFLALTLGVVTLLSLLGFGVGALVARALGASAPERVSLMFSLGMTNNGTGLVIAARAFSGTPMALLPILGYNLAQHLVAGFVSARLNSRNRLQH
jgi:BASS family bile acid:Na+ symporter